MPPTRVSYQCPHCRFKPYVQRGRLNNHIRDHHPDEYQRNLEDIEKLTDPTVRITPPPAPVGTVPDGYERIMVELQRPLTSLETRITTTNQVEDEDYDSPDEDPGGEDSIGIMMDITDAVSNTGEVDISPAQHLVEFPEDIEVVGSDSAARYLDLKTLWRPFRNGYEFKLARWMMDSGLTKQSIDRFFNDGLARTPPPSYDGTEGTCFTSAYTLANLLDNLDSELSIASWRKWAVDHTGVGLIEFRYRGVESMIRHIFKQPSHEPYMIYKPIQEFSSSTKEYRLLSDLHTADWWWEMQKLIPKSHFIIPLIFGSDETFQTNFSGDKNIWPLTMSVGNIPSKHRNKPLTAAWRLLALLPIRPKRASKQNVDEEKTSALETVQMVLEKVLKELQPLWDDGIQITCPDGKIRVGHPVIVGWLGDYPEYTKLFTSSYMSCPICVAPRHQMDAHSSLPIAHRQLNPDLLRASVARYRELQKVRSSQRRGTAEYLSAKTEIEAIQAWASTQRIRLVDNLLFRLPYSSPTTLWKPDLLHTMDLGMIKHALEWMFNMLDEHGKGLADLYDVTWMTISPHPAIKVPKKRYRAVKQWSGKEYRNAASIMLAILEATLDPFPADDIQQAVFDKSMDCIGAILDFYLMAQYSSHSFPSDKTFDNGYRALSTGHTSPNPSDTVSYLQHYLALFHNNKDTFLKYRASKTVKKDAATFASGSVPAITPEEEKAMSKPELLARKKADTDIKKSLMEQYKLENSSYNLPKVHVMSHFGETIPMYGALKPWSTTIVELNHQPLNLAYNQSNKVDATEQTLRYAGHKDAMSIRVANYLHLLADTTVADEVVEDLKLWLSVFGSKKARLVAARIARDRMRPAKADAEDIARKKSLKADREEVIRALRVQYGYAVSQGDEDTDSDTTDDEGPSTSDREASAVGRLLKGRMLTVRAASGIRQSLMTLGNIETFLNVSGLVNALVDLMKNEKTYTRPSADLVHQYHASPYMALRIRRPVFQSATDLENHIIRCTSGENFRNKHPRADFVIYQSPSDGYRQQAVIHPVMGDRSVGQVLCFFRVEFPPLDDLKANIGRFAAIRPMVQLPMTPSQQRRAMPRFKWTDKDIMVIRIGSIERAACVVPVLPSLRDIPAISSELLSQATKFVLNTKVDLETFATLY